MDYVTDPGRYHGEPVWVPYAYEQFLAEDWKSWREGDDVVAYAPVSQQDVEWGFDMELGMFKALVLSQDSSVHGFLLSDPPIDSAMEEGV